MMLSVLRTAPEECRRHNVDVDRITISGDRNVVQLGERNISIGQAHDVEILDPHHP